MRKAALLFALVLIVGCLRQPPPRVQIVEDEVMEPKEESKPIYDPNALDNEIRAMTPIEPAAPEKLIALLPAAPDGFRAEEPHGETIAFGQFKYSHAERKYTKDFKVLSIKIQDRARIAQLYTDIAAKQKLKVRNEDGQHLGLTIDGNPAIEQYKVATDWSELTVLIGARHLVTIQAEGLQPEFLRAAYQSIDVRSLAALK